MNKAVERSAVRRIPVLILVLLLGAFLLPLTTSPAYAVDNNPSSLQTESAQVSLMAGELTASMSATPSNKGSQYEVYPTYFYVNTGANECDGCELYLKYRQTSADGKKWGNWKTSKPLHANSDYKISGLKPNRKTQTIFVYSSLGSQYAKGAASESKLATFKTGPNKKPAIKSVKAQAVKVKKHKKHHVSPYSGYVYRTIYDVYYTYNLQVTVTLKKPLKANYLVINNKIVKAKGKKTVRVTTAEKTGTYSTQKPNGSFSPRGSKYSVSVRICQNKAWKGYSSLYQTKAKIK